MFILSSIYTSSLNATLFRNKTRGFWAGKRRCRLIYITKVSPGHIVKSWNQHNQTNKNNGISSRETQLIILFIIGKLTDDGREIFSCLVMMMMWMFVCCCVISFYKFGCRRFMFSRPLYTPSRKWRSEQTTVADDDHQQQQTSSAVNKFLYRYARLIDRYLLVDGEIFQENNAAADNLLSFYVSIAGHSVVSIQDRLTYNIELCI